MIKKGQIQVPLLLLLILGLFLLYLLWINPSDRAKILGIDESSSSTSVNSSSSVDKVVFSKNIGFIGRRTGNSIGTHDFSSVSVSYPLVNESVLPKGSAVLIANVLLKGSTRVTIPGSYSSVIVRMRVGDVVGTPNIEIKTGNVILYRSAISKNQNIDLNIDGAKIIADSLEVSCNWKGLAFWQSQKCELLDFEVVKQAYSSVNPVEVRDFSVSNSESQGDNFKLCFTVDNSVNSGSLSIDLNGFEIYNANPLTRSAAYCIRNSLSSSDISSGTNILGFSASEGGVYDLKDVSFITYEESSDASNQTFYFSIPSSVYDKALRFRVEFFVDDIVDAGGLDVVLGNVYYYLGPNDLVEGLNSIDVDKSDVISGTNKMRVESSTGRFKIGDFSLVWE